MVDFIASSTLEAEQRSTKVVDFVSKRVVEIASGAQPSQPPRESAASVGRAHTPAKAAPASLPIVRPDGDDPAATAAYLEDRERRGRALEPLLAAALRRASLLNSADDAFIEIRPIASCFGGRPPKPEIVHAEVIAALIGEDVIQSWIERDCLRRALSIVASAVRQEFRAREGEQRYNTFLFTYSSKENDDLQSGRSHRLIDVDLDTIHRDNDSAAGGCLIREVNQLLNKLDYDVTALKRSLALSGVPERIVERLTEGVGTLPVTRAEEQDRAKHARLVDQSANLFLLSAPTACVALILAFSTGSQILGVALSIVALVAAFGMIAAGKLAREAWPDEDSAPGGAISD